MSETATPKILFVDDEPNVLAALRRLLHGQRDSWRMTFCECPFRAWESLTSERYDAAVCDVRMPGMTGLELLQRMQSAEELREIPVVIVTGMGDRDLKRKALELGAADLLNKPVDRDDLLARLHSVLRLKSYQDELHARNDLLEQRVRERTEELALSQLEIIWRLGKAAEFRDEETGNHVIRVGCYSRAVAQALGMDDGFVETLFLAAPLHDIGKIGVSDSVLGKPGKLSEEEWRAMRRHCAIGAAILAEDAKMMRIFASVPAGARRPRASDVENPILQMGARIALNHHEKWDGSGYPRGLAGEEIPLEARIVAIADVYDALRSARPYKSAFSQEKSLSILDEGAGRHFDPDVHTAFLASLDVVREIEAEFSDQEHRQPSVEVCLDQYSVC